MDWIMTAFLRNVVCLFAIFLAILITLLSKLFEVGGHLLTFFWQVGKYHCLLP